MRCAEKTEDEETEDEKAEDEMEIEMKMERETRFELATSTLARLRSTN